MYNNNFLRDRNFLNNKNIKINKQLIHKECYLARNKFKKGACQKCKDYSSCATYQKIPPTEEFHKDCFLDRSYFSITGGGRCKECKDWVSCNVNY